jgi:hypothetical protein
VLVLTTSNITDAIGFSHSFLSFSPPHCLPPSQPALVFYSRHPPYLCLRLPAFGYCSYPLLSTPSLTFSTTRQITSAIAPSAEASRPDRPPSTALFSLASLLQMWLSWIAPISSNILGFRMYHPRPCSLFVCRKFIHIALCRSLKWAAAGTL